MKVLGLDVSLTSTGIAVVHTNGTARTANVPTAPPKRAKGDKTPPTLTERQARLRGIRDEIRIWAVDAALAVVEAPSYGSVGAGTWERAWLWGSIIDQLFAADIPVAIVPPKSVKLWATGRGDAGKTAMAVCMSRIWPDVDPLITEDEWDALAAASIGAQHLGWLPVELARHREQLAKVAWPELVSA